MHYDKNKIIFVHIPKNAGSSVCHLLDKYIQCIDHNIDFKKFDKQYIELIILRDPVSRFISAVNWTINKYKKYKIGYVDSKLLKNNFISPNEWASAFLDKNHMYHIPVMNTINTSHVLPSCKNHMVDNQKLNTRWQFAYQTLWFREPAMILIFDNLNKEVEYFCNHILNIFNINLSHKNYSIGDTYMSTTNRIKLIEYYIQDYTLYTKYKNISIEQRMMLPNINKYSIYDNIWI